MKGKFETGLKLDKTSGSSVGFLIRGVTTACLKLAGTVPRLRDSLIILVIGSIKLSMFSFKSDVGRGSREHDLVGDDKIICLTSLEVTCLKENIFEIQELLNCGVEKHIESSF